MPLKINRRLFDLVKSAIAETMRVDMLYWAKIEGIEAVTSVSEIRALPLLSDCWTVACIGGWACFLATDEEIASAIEAYGLSPDVDDPFTLASALLLSGADDINALEDACFQLFSGERLCLEPDAYANPGAAEVRVQAVLRRMDDWATGIEQRGSEI